MGFRNDTVECCGRDVSLDKERCGVAPWAGITLALSGWALLKFVKGVDGAGDCKSFLLFCLYLEGARGARELSRAVSAVGRAVDPRVEP
jgi:hypothetical protein